MLKKRAELKPRFTHILTTQPPELLKKMDDSAKLLVESKGQCDGIRCRLCAGTLIYNYRTDCDKNGWRTDTFIDEKDQTAVRSAKQFRKEYKEWRKGR
jgi:hypothetical protein